MGWNTGELKPPTDSIALCALLGNPGRRYAQTRHNAAWLLGDLVWGDALPWREKFHGALCQVDGCTLLRPPHDDECERKIGARGGGVLQARPVARRGRVRRR